MIDLNGNNNDLHYTILNLEYTDILVDINELHIGIYFKYSETCKEVIIYNIYLEGVDGKYDKCINYLPLKDYQIILNYLVDYMDEIEAACHECVEKFILS